MRRCSGVKPDGTQCTLTVEAPETYCWHHTLNGQSSAAARLLEAEEAALAGRSGQSKRR